MFLSGTMRQQVPMANSGSRCRGNKASAGGSGTKLGGGAMPLGMT